ncbi:MAG: hypothetical protein IKC69_05835 [Clostridia bacterium]|nr:hypothetical protein [Clostridia bacterium]
MDGNFSDKLKGVLSDPDAMATITALAKKMAAKEGRSAPAEEHGASEAPFLPEPSPQGLPELFSQPAIAAALRVLGEGSKERIQLLCAMRPFVKEEKKEKLDKIIQTMKTLDLLVSAQKLL